MGCAEKGLVITTGGFTRDARQEARRDGATAIDLIDGELLADKLKATGTWREHEDSRSRRDRRELVLISLDLSTARLGRAEGSHSRNCRWLMAPREESSSRA